MSESEYILEATDADFEFTVLARSREIPVVVDFWAPWSQPSQTLNPILEKIADEAQGAFLLAQVNVDDNPTLAARYSVQGLPSIKVFHDGTVVDQFTGPQPEAKVREFIRKVAPTGADLAREAARSLLATRHWAQAEESYRQVFSAQPQDSGAALGLVKSLLAQGKGCEADSILQDFPGSNNDYVIAEKLKPLADLLCEVEPADPPLADAEADLDPLYYNAGRLLARGQWEAGLDGLLETLRRNKRYRKGAPKDVILGLFELMGEDDPRTHTYRQELASVLF
jgi:putative thioredoxin